MHNFKTIKMYLLADVFTFKLLQRGHTNGIYEANYKKKFQHQVVREK
jgi:hypothetical protein